MIESDISKSRNIVLYDGNCGFCDGTVQWLLKHDHRRQLYFAALQSPLGSELIQKADLPKDLDSIIFVQESTQMVSYYSTAIFDILQLLPWPWRLGVLGKVLPKFFRDNIYRWIARNRIRWFGTVDACKLPTEDERSRFLS